MEADLREEFLKKQPILMLGGDMTALYSYRLDDGGIYFCELKDDLSGSPQVNYARNFILLNSAGRTFRDQDVQKKIRENAERAIFAEV